MCVDALLKLTIKVSEILYLFFIKIETRLFLIYYLLLIKNKSMITNLCYKEMYIDYNSNPPRIQVRVCPCQKIKTCLPIFVHSLFLCLIFFLIIFRQIFVLNDLYHPFLLSAKVKVLQVKHKSLSSSVILF